MYLSPIARYKWHVKNQDLCVCVCVCVWGGGGGGGVIKMGSDEEKWNKIKTYKCLIIAQLLKPSVISARLKIWIIMKTKRLCASKAVVECISWLYSKERERTNMAAGNNLTF